jgi:hypothetical protein
VLVSQPAAAQDVGSRLRTEEPQIRALIAEGVAKSPTFAALAAALDQTDVIVHVRSSLLDRIRGRIPHTVIVASGNRYVRIQIMTTGTDNQIIGVLAHEMQHAMEIAQAPAVGRSQTVEDLFRRIGYRLGVNYETDAATEIGRKVRNEVCATPEGCR